ncbi:alpha/beta hydrolase [Nocardioides sp.]|uniref:alpha/beta hydrolase n=1 Tax=Nocardioides sp. TaxID=35761 RepID=UPI002CC34D4D|nr:alpha/beta fold hydrolase [Nocardioides sp.]HXH79800.1 alpha/beta fold hydrolase [Nocardioides sp.]
MSDPILSKHDAPETTRGLILMFHGGKDRSKEDVDGRSLSWKRSLAMQRSIAPAAHEDDLSVWLLRYRQRGWNGGRDRIADARWALDQVRSEHPGVPITLLGHSMGARVAVHVADDPQVRGVVGLAPWLPGGESIDALAGRDLVVAHGRRDRITSFKATAAYVERARTVASSAEMHDMGPVGHYMLKGSAAWNAVALSASLGVLTD